MFEYDEPNNSDQEEQLVLTNPKTTKTTKKTKKTKPEPQPDSESDSGSESDQESSSKAKPEKFLTGSNFDEFEQDRVEDQEKIQIQKKEDQDQEEPILSADDIEELRELLKNWLELDDANKELSDRMKDIKMEKKQYESYILGFMDKTNKEIIKASDSNLVLRKEVKETRAKPNEENILKVLTRVLGDATQAYKFTQEIIEDAPIKETISLKKDSAKPKNTKRTTKRVKKDI
jgi:hypothetical protein